MLVTYKSICYLKRLFVEGEHGPLQERESSLRVHNTSSDVASKSLCVSGRGEASDWPKIWPVGAAQKSRDLIVILSAIDAATS